MIEAKINDQTYNVPECWDDLTYSIAIGVYVAHHAGAEESEIISKSCLIPMDVLYSVSERSVKELAGRLEFLSDLTIFDKIEPKEEYKDFDYGSITYGKAEKCRQLVDEKKTMFENVVPMFKELFDVDLTNEPFAEWIGTVNFFLNQWFRFTLGSRLSAKVDTLMSKNSPESEGLTSSGPLVLT